jgi:hypothetical protein
MPVKYADQPIKSFSMLPQVSRFFPMDVSWSVLPALGPVSPLSQHVHLKPYLSRPGCNALD